MIDTQFVILAGGLGTRLYPITEKIPKPIVEIAGRPYLEWQFLELRAQGVRNVLLLTGHLGEQIEEVFGSGQRLDLSIQYSKEPEPLGTGGALRFAAAKLKDRFVLLNGDSFLPMNFGSLLSGVAVSTTATVVTYSNQPPTPVPNNLKVQGGYVVEYKKNGGREQGFQCVDAGIYLIDKKGLFQNPLFRSNEKFALESLWPALIQEKTLAAHPVNQRFFDIGTPERLKEFQEFVHDHFKNTVSR